MIGGPAVDFHQLLCDGLFVALCGIDIIVFLVFGVSFEFGGHSRHFVGIVRERNVGYMFAGNPFSPLVREQERIVIMECVDDAAVRNVGHARKRL